MDMNLTGIQYFRSRAMCIFLFPYNDINFKIDFRNKLLYKTLEEMVIFHKLDIYDKNDIEKLIECCLQHLSNEILKYCLKNYIESNMKTSTRKIKNYFNLLKGYPSLNGESGIFLQKVYFYSLNFDESNFEIQNVDRESLL